MIEEKIAELASTIEEVAKPTWWAYIVDSASVLSGAAAAAGLIFVFIQLRRTQVENEEVRARHEEEMAALKESIVTDTRQADAQLIIDRFENYERLYSDIMITYQLMAKHESLLADVSYDEFSPETLGMFGPDFFNVATLVDPTKPGVVVDAWESARRLKTFYKSGYALIEAQIFSRRALALSLKRGTYRDLRKIRALDVCRFYYGAYSKGQGVEEAREAWDHFFRDQYYWYEELIRFVEGVDLAIDPSINLRL